MISNKGMRLRALAAAAAMSAVLATSSLAAFAATGTVSGTQVNVRSDASTSSSVVGTANTGETYDLGEAKTDDTGATWYQIQLANGSTGYIRNDFITVTEDAAPAEGDAAAVDAGAESGDVEVADDGSAEQDPAADASAAQVTDTGDYQIVLAPDENGTDTYYLYDNAKGERMKLSDIGALQQAAADAQKEAKAAGTKYKLIVVVLAVLFVVALIGCIFLFLRLRDALTNGRKERDLTQERRNARKEGRNADGLGDLHRGVKSDRRAARNRGDAYPSGARRPEGAPAAGVRRPDGAPARRPEGASAAGVRRPDGAAGARRPEGAPVRRPVAGDEDVRRAERPVRPGSTPVRRPVRPGAAPDAAQAATARPARPAAPAGARPAAPAEKPAAPKAKPVSDDDDFDYDFISLDDDNK